MRANLVAWQWSLYPENHRLRRTLVLHALTQPLFVLGTLSLLSTPLTGWRGLLGLVAMVLTLALQGRAHKQESAPPVPFEGPMDFVSRFFCEQFVSWPRFVLSGGFGRAWREAGAQVQVG